MEKTLEEGRADEGEAAQVWSEGGQGQNSGNRAGLIKQIQDRCGGKIMLVRKNRRGEKKTI